MPRRRSLQCPQAARLPGAADRVPSALALQYSLQGEGYESLMQLLDQDSLLLQHIRETFAGGRADAEATVKSGTRGVPGVEVAGEAAEAGPKAEETAGGTDGGSEASTSA